MKPNINIKKKKKKKKKTKKNKFHIVGTKSNRQIVEPEVKSMSPTCRQIDCSLCWFGTGTLKKSGGVKIVLWAQTFHLFLVK